MLASDYIPMRQGKPITLLAWMINERNEPELFAIDRFRVLANHSLGVQRENMPPLRLEARSLPDLQRGIAFFVEYAKSPQAELNLIAGNGLEVVVNLGRVLNATHITIFTPKQAERVLKMITIPADRLTEPRRPRGRSDNALKRALGLD